MIELRSPAPTTDFCRPTEPYNKPQWEDTRPLQVDIRDDGLYIDNTRVADRHHWDDDPRAESHPLHDGRWLITVRGVTNEHDPDEIVIEPGVLAGDWPDSAYLWDPTTAVATDIGRIYVHQNYLTDGLILSVRHRALWLADIDPDRTTPRVRVRARYEAVQRVVGYSAGTAVLWKREGETVELSCLGSPARTIHVTVPPNLAPVNNAVHDQRMLVQAISATKPTSEVWIVDLDQHRSRWIGTAPTSCLGALHDTYDNACNVISDVRWLGPELEETGITFGGITRVDTGTEALSHSGR